MPDDMTSLLARINDINQHLGSIDMSLQAMAEQTRLTHALLVDLGRRITDLEKTSSCPNPPSGLTRTGEEHH